MKLYVFYYYFYPINIWFNTDIYTLAQQVDKLGWDRFDIIITPK